MYTEDLLCVVFLLFAVNGKVLCILYVHCVL